MMAKDFWSQVKEKWSESEIEREKEKESLRECVLFIFIFFFKNIEVGVTTMFGLADGSLLQELPNLDKVLEFTRFVF